MSHKLKKWVAKKINNERNKKLEDNKEQQQKKLEHNKKRVAKKLFCGAKILLV